MFSLSLFWARLALSLYTFGLATALVTLAVRRETLSRLARGAVALGFLFHFVSIVEIGVLLHRFPVTQYSQASSLLAFIIVAFFLVFVVVTILAGAIGRIVSWGVREAGLRWVDRVLGAAFGVVRGLLVVTVIVMATAAFAPNAQWLRQSQTAPYFLVIGRGASWLAPAEVRNRVREGMDLLHSGKQKIEESKKPDGSSPVPDEKRSAVGGR